MLKLNQDKTEVIVISTKVKLSKQSLHSINFGNVCLPVSNQAKSLGVTFDERLTLKKHVSDVCRSCYFHLHNIARIRRCLDRHTAETVVHALITSRLDYCNSVLYGVSEGLLQRLQMVQNSAARIVTMSCKRQHITPILKTLHWLPVKYRIQYKALLLTYKVVSNKAPQYLQDLLHPYEQERNLRSTSQGLLEIPATKLKTFGDRAFSVYAPRLWNALPIQLRLKPSVEAFKKGLKEYLFKLCYD